MVVMADGSSPQKYNPGRPIDLHSDDYPRRTLPETSEESSAKSDERQVPVDQEIAAIRKIVDSLEPLNPDARVRVLRWAISRFGL